MARCVNSATFDSAIHTSYTDCGPQGGNILLTSSLENSTAAWVNASNSLTEGHAHAADHYWYPTNPLIRSVGLDASCREHVLDMGPCAHKTVQGTNETKGTGHDGNDGSSAGERANRWISAAGTGENLAYG